MAKGYWIARVDVTDAEAYKAYATGNAKAFAKYGARFLVRGGAYHSREGKPRERNIVIEFADYKTAVACYDLPEYQEVLKLRANASHADLIIIEGYDGAQPQIAVA